jgi:hypothetical protein
LTGQPKYYPPNFPPGLLAVPATEWMWTQSANALIGLIGWMPPRSGVQINQQSSSVAANRNTLIDRFLTQPQLEWILFVDSDMTPDPETTCQLLSHNVDVVGALYYSRDGKYMPMYGELPDQRGGRTTTGLRKVDWVGTGCMLIRKKVLEAMQPPYMEFLAPGIAEDVYFCRKAMNLGFGVYVDTAHCVGHMSAAPIDAEAAMLYGHLPRVQSLRKETGERSSAAYDANGVRTEEPEGVPQRGSQK